MKTEALLKAVCLDKKTGFEIEVPELSMSLSSKDVRCEQQKLMTFHNLNKESSKAYQYKCSCYSNPIVFVFNKKGKYHLRDQHINQHDNNCALHTVVVQTDEKGKKIGLKSSMFKMPTSRKKREQNNRQSFISTSYKVVNQKDEKSTFNGLMASVIDVASTISNSKYEQANTDNFIKILQNQMFNMPCAKDSTLGEYRNKLKEKGMSLYFNNVIVDDIVIKPQNKYMLATFDGLNKSLETNLENKQKKFFKINEDVHGIRGDILLKALQILKIHDNYIKGPYLITTIKIKSKGAQYHELPLLHICPIMISKTHILPVESHLERECTAYIVNNGAKGYKPFSLDKNIYWSQLITFLEDKKEDKVDIREAYLLCGGNKKPVIRPDLYFIYKDEVYVIEITGMLNDPIYKKRVEEKEDKFYSHLKKIRYIKASSVESLKYIFEN